MGRVVRMDAHDTRMDGSHGIATCSAPGEIGTGTPLLVQAHPTCSADPPPAERISECPHTLARWVSLNSPSEPSPSNIPGAPRESTAATQVAAVLFVKVTM